MKKNAKLWILAGVLVLTAAVAVIHLTTRTVVPEGRLLIVYNGAESEITLSELDLQPVRGTVSNAKGETRTIDAQGIPVADVLSQAGVDDFTKVTVVADDEYRAEVMEEELSSNGQIYFILQEEGGFQMIVFTDSNSKRNVSNVARIEVL